MRAYQNNRDVYEGGQLHQVCSKCLWWQSGHGLEILNCPLCDAATDTHVGLLFGGIMVEFDGVHFIFHDRQYKKSVSVDRADYPDVISFMLRHAIEGPLAGNLGKHRPIKSCNGNYHGEPLKTCFTILSAERNESQPPNGLVCS